MSATSRWKIFAFFICLFVLVRMARDRLSVWSDENGWERERENSKSKSIDVNGAKNARLFSTAAKLRQHKVK